MDESLSRGFVKFFVDFFSSKCTKIFWQASELRKIGSARPPPSRAFLGVFVGGGCMPCVREFRDMDNRLCVYGRMKQIETGGVFREKKLFQ